MPFALLIIGLVLLVSSIRNTQNDLFKLVISDFSGQNNYLFWVVSILLIGAVGYIPKLKPISTAFLVLVILVLVLTKGNPNSKGGGLFSQFTSALNATTSAKPDATATATGSTASHSLPQLPNLDLGSLIMF